MNRLLPVVLLGIQKFEQHSARHKKSKKCLANTMWKNRLSVFFLFSIKYVYLENKKTSKW